MLDFTRTILRHTAGLRSGWRFMQQIRGKGPRDGREVPIAWKEAGRKLTLLPRAGTTDISTAGEVFAAQHYRLPDAWQPRTILDVGGNAGMVTLYYATHYPQAAIHSFEPVPANAERIRRHVAANQLTNVTVHEYGLSDADGTLEMRSSGSGSFWDFSTSRSEGGPAVPAQMRHAGNVFDSLGVESIDLLKFDIEGGETHFLPAIAAWLPRVKWIIGELHGYHCRDWLPCLEILGRTHFLEMSRKFRAPAFIFCAARGERETTEWAQLLAQKRV